MTVILNGKEVRGALIPQLQKRVSLCKNHPQLVVIQVGNNPDSTVYINQKKKFGDEIGVIVHHIVLPIDVLEQDVLNTIETYNKDTDISGIIVQLPIPDRLDKDRILNSIDQLKDVDGLRQCSHCIPATARGVMTLCDYYHVDLSGKHVVVIGRSQLVGMPTALECLRRDATVTVCHSHTQNLATITQSADILIVACGVPRYINQDYVKEGQVVIDVGIHKTESGICGDVDYKDVVDIVSAISPVPGGVGPLTVVSLFQNLCDMFEQQHSVV